ncbi:unnamed protein product [Triticum turgidum subsp. durum]|uniref:CASP-like protein n=1 Tax=Triticum turgidum subsp. durum TaxID=4567 RepID=A0A9R0Z3U7_TRITD|nr:unnamed protein product [Triticum turgidum subsp. durum]
MAKLHRLVSVVLRLVAAVTAAAAAIIMVTSRETTSLFGLEIEANFFVVAYAVACVYSLLVILVPPGGAASRLVVMADVAVGRNGNEHAGWLPICEQVHGYCNQVMGALIAGFVALVVYFLIIMHSLHAVTDTMCPCH